MDPKRPATDKEAALEAAKLQMPPRDPEADEKQIVAAAPPLAGEATGQSEQAGKAADSIPSGDPADAPDGDSSQATLGEPQEVDEETSTIDDGLDDASPSDPPPPDVSDFPAHADEGPFDDTFDTAEPATIHDADASELAFDEAPSAPLPATNPAATTFADALGRSMPEVIEPRDERTLSSSPLMDPLGADVSAIDPADTSFDRVKFDAPNSSRPSANRQGAFRDLLMRSNDPPGTIERGPYILGQGWAASEIQLDASDIASPESGVPEAAASEPVGTTPATDAETPSASLPLAMPVMLRNADQFVQPVMDAITALMKKVADERAEYQIYRREHHKEAELRAIYGPD